jgi:DNA end-binding protein Ku
MVDHPYWSGRLRMSLVQFGIQLYPAVNLQAGVRFHEVDRESGERIHHLNVVGQNRPVDNTEIVKGYEYRKGKYLLIEPEEIEILRIQSRSVIEVRQFVDLESLPLGLFKRPYFVVPQPDEPVDAFAVVRRAMQESSKAALGEVTFAGREHLIVIAASANEEERGLLAFTLRYSEELRGGAKYFAKIHRVELDKKQLAMAGELIRAYSRPLKLDTYKDDYQAALRQLLEAKKKHKPLPLEKEEQARGKVIDLMDALRQSVTQTRRTPAGRKRVSAGVPGKGPILVKSSKRKHKAA